MNIKDGHITIRLTVDAAGVSTVIVTPKLMTCHRHILSFVHKCRCVKTDGERGCQQSISCHET